MSPDLCSNTKQHHQHGMTIHKYFTVIFHINLQLYTVIL